MNKFICIPAMTLLLSFTAAGQIQQYDLKGMNLKGKVHTVTERSYKTIEKAGEVQKVDKSVSTMVMDFNESGYLTIKRWLNQDGSLDRKDTCRYDKAGHLIEIDRLDAWDNLERKMTFKYDENGKISEKNSYNPDGSLDNRSVYRYTKNKNLIDELFYDKNGDRDNGNTFLYDSLWQLTHEYLPRGIGVTNDYRYDEFGNTVEKIQHFSGSDFRQYIYKYDYDQNFNWTKKEEFVNEEQVSLTERVISYF